MAKKYDVPDGWTSDWGNVQPIEPTEELLLDEEWIEQFPLETKGRYIMNRFGNRFRLIGVNWYGASDTLHIVGGLNVQSLDKICRTVSDLGFTVVRLPFSNEMLRIDHQQVAASDAINYQLNSDLRHKGALEVYDAVVDCLGQHRVTVIINNHTTYGEFCGPPSSNSLWFDPTGPFSEAQWLADWTMMAKRYSRCPHVIGYDLRNEIRPRLSVWPLWNRGSNTKLSGRRDWAAASRAAAEQLLEVNPGALVVVERIVWPQSPINEYAASPGPLLPSLSGHLVLGVHHYSWSGPGRFVPNWSVPDRWQCFLGVFRALGIVAKHNYGMMDKTSMEEQISLEWGSLLRDNVCPVWVSEFGADLGIKEEMEWMQNFVPILSALDADWAYWPLNVGPKPTCGSDEAYGMLRSDWLPKPSSSDDRLKLLEKLGLKMKEGATIPSIPDNVVPDTPDNGSSRLKALFGKKDPLFGVKHMPDPRSLGMIIPQSIDLSSFQRKKVLKTNSAPHLQALVGLLSEPVMQRAGSTSMPDMTRIA